MSSNETASFMVRFTQKIFEDESGQNDVQWRGRISHVQGGDQQAFTDFKDAMTFIQDHLADMTIKNTQHVAPDEQDGHRNDQRPRKTSSQHPATNQYRQGRNRTTHIRTTSDYSGD